MKSKKKEEAIKKEARKVVLQTPSAEHTAERAKAHEDEAIPAAELWASEVEALKAKNFASVEDAVAHVVDRVLERMSIKEFSEEERAVLTLAFETDPVLLATIQRVCRISS